MMKILVIVHTILVLLSPISALSQDSYCNCNTHTTLNLEGKLLGKAFTNDHPGKGLLFYKGWNTGEVLTTDGRLIRGKVLTYHRLLDELIWKRGIDNQQIILDRSNIAGFSLYGVQNEKIAEFRKIALNSSKSNSVVSYLQVLTEGKITLFAKRGVIWSSNTSEVWTKEQYYLLRDGKLISLAPKPRDLYSSTGSDRVIMKTIVRKNGLKLKNESDLVRAIQLYNREIQ